MKSQRILRFQNLIDSHLFPFTLILIPFLLPYPKLIFFNLLVIVLVFFWLIKGNLKNRIGRIFKNKLALLFIANYLIFVICLVYSDDKKTGLWLLEKRAAILLFPIILFTERLDKKLIEKILLSFVLSCIVATFFSIFYVIFVGSQSSSVETSPLTIESFSRDNFSMFLDLHPTYYGIYITFSTVLISFFMMRSWKELNPAKKIVTSVLLIYLIIITILLSARMPQIVLVLIMGVVYIRFLIKRLVPALLMLVVTLGVIGVVFQKYPHLIEDRFKEIKYTEWAPPVGIYHNSTNLRIGIWLCSLELLKQNWIFGFGTGNVQDNLDNCYQSSGYSDVLYKLHYNTHNEYFNTWLNTGVTGLFIFLLTLFIPLKEAYKRKAYLYMAFLMVIMLSCLTESILERQKGIVFYAFFNALLALNLQAKVNSAQTENLLNNNVDPAVNKL